MTTKIIPLAEKREKLVKGYLKERIKDLFGFVESHAMDDLIHNLLNKLDEQNKEANKNLKKELKKNEVKELAVFLHNIYEDFSKKGNWKTQKKCRVKFDDLPEENKNVMLKVSACLIMRNNKKINKAFEEVMGEIK